MPIGYEIRCNYNIIMPIQYNKVPVTLQEKIDKAMKLTFEIRNPGDADFMRDFLISLIERGYLRVDHNQEVELEKQLENYKKQQQ